MRYPGKWEKDKWRVTQPGNYQWHYAEHENGMMLWLTDPGGRGDNWSVMAGTGTGPLDDRTHLASSLPNKQIAEGIIQEAMKDHPNPSSPYDMKRYGGRGAFGSIG